MDSIKNNLSDVFMDRYGDSKIAPPKLFAYCFNNIPNTFEIKNIDALGLFGHLKETGLIKKIIEELICESCFIDGMKKPPDFLNNVICILETKELFYVDRNSIYYYYDKENFMKIQDFILLAEKFPPKEEGHWIRMLVQNNDGYSFKTFEITLPVLNLAKTYNDDIIDFNDNILKKLNDPNGKGMVFLYGNPGTGKTTYIRHLVSKIKKDILYISSTLAGSLANPSLLHLLSKKPGCVIVIEDAEQVIMSREYRNNDAVSTLLNLSDGLLSDILKIQIICTFNTSITNIDKALLRSGRMIGKYEFKELNRIKAQTLSDDLGYKVQITEPVAISEIFSEVEISHPTFNTIKKIGF
jgi:hypothetical protein